jgi:hypothetical protein
MHSKRHGGRCPAGFRVPPRPSDTTFTIPNQLERDMTNPAKAAGLAGILAAVLATTAPALSATPRDEAVREGQAVVTELDATTSAVTYWTDEADGWHVVTTVDAVTGQGGDAEKHGVVRFSSLLLPGQSQLISVPSGAGEQQQVLRIHRLGDQIEVARVHGSSV